jgi:hypothetical protein
MTVEPHPHVALHHRVVAGAWRFMLVALLGFAPWALGGRWLTSNLGEIGLYGTCLLAFLLGAMLWLPPLLSGPHRWWQTLRYFIPAFIAYAVIWTLCWFLLGGKKGEWSGAILGGIAFTLWCAWRLGRPRWLGWTCLVFVAAHAIGYFSCEFAMSLLAKQYAAKTLGMWAWGLCYGLGFGAGLGYVVAVCQGGQASTEAARSTPPPPAS